jgi:hypothetical protein
MTRSLLFVLYALYAIALSAGLARAGHWSRVASPGGAPRKRLTRVLIVGATGGTGRQLVAQALERGLAVTALVRSSSKLHVNHPQLTVVQGDVLDYASVEAAMRGQEAVVGVGDRSTWGADQRRKARTTSPWPRVGSFLGTVRISRADVADFMLNQLDSDTYIGAAPGVAW